MKTYDQCRETAKIWIENANLHKETCRFDAQAAFIAGYLEGVKDAVFDTQAAFIAEGVKDAVEVATRGVTLESIANKLKTCSCDLRSTDGAHARSCPNR